MIKKGIQIVLVIACFSCASKTQEEGLAKIENHYGAKVSYTKSIETSEDKGAENMFNIIVENSSMLDTLRHDLTSTNIAVMLYNDLTQEEKESCELITVKLINSSTDNSTKYKLKSAVLKECEDQSKIYVNFSENLLKKNYDEIAANILPKYQSETLAEGVAQFIKELSQEHGKLKEYKGTGIGLITMPDKEQLYQFSGYLTFKDGYKRPYIITTSKNIDENRIYGFNLNNVVL